MGQAAVNVAMFPLTVASMPFVGMGKLLKGTALLMERKSSKMTVAIYGNEGHYRVACTGSPFIKTMSRNESIALEDLFQGQLVYTKFIPTDNPERVHAIWDKEEIKKRIESGISISGENQEQCKVLRTILKGIREAMNEEADLIKGARIGSLRL